MQEKLTAGRCHRVSIATLAVLLVSAMGFPGVGSGDTTSAAAMGPTLPKNYFSILMNYELGMHCTGFEFSYCCVLPPYNSILAQVVKTQQTTPMGMLSPSSTSVTGNTAGTYFPVLLQADPVNGLDFLGRPTVLRDTSLDSKGHFQKYVLRYWHDAQPRNDGRGAPQASTLISQVEGNSLLMWNTRLAAAAVDSGNKIQYGTYDNQNNVVLGDSTTWAFAQDNYANAWLNHLYIYSDLSGSNPANTSLEKNKIRLGLPNTNASTVFSTILPQNSGPAFHPMGPGSTPGLQNVLTFSEDTGTVVFTQMKVLENLPIMLTSPRIWEALGLPLTPFEDTINFFGNPGAVSEETIRPYVKMNAQLHNYDPKQPGGIGTAVLQNGNPIVGFGDAPIDVPNCERCHSLPPPCTAIPSANPPVPAYPEPCADSANNPSNGGGDHAAIQANALLETEFWNAYYGINTKAGQSDYYSRLKGAAYSILAIHDNHHGTAFTANWPCQDASCTTWSSSGLPQTTRLGHESVMCQKCHADNVIAKVKSANVGIAAEGNDPVGTLIPPLTEALHNGHIDRVFNDSLGRNGACQGCHPAHRSDGNLANYPIIPFIDGVNNVGQPPGIAPATNAFANGDNRDAAGGCYVGRDVHSNRNKNADLSAQPHLNAIGAWLVKNVASDTGTYKGIWCTNCHTQLSRQIWKAENNADLVHATPGPGNVRDPVAGGGASLNDVVKAVNANLPAAEQFSVGQAKAWLDPKFDAADTYAVWNNAGTNADGTTSVNYPDANVATIEVLNGAPVGTTDADGDFSVKILDFCTTPDCVAAAQATLTDGGTAVPVPFQAADDARDHWLSPGAPHCADCHKSPYTEQSGNINFFPPFNYPRKAALFRYSRGHRDITCQGCHESTHGLYPVTSDVDTTTYAQAANLNTDGSHGPLKCGACHEVNQIGVPLEARGITYNGVQIFNNFDAAVSWAHTFTQEADPRKDVCVACHVDFSSFVSASNSSWLLHTDNGDVSRKVMDQVEIAQLGHVSGDPAAQNPLTTVCVACHADLSNKVGCSNTNWKLHVPAGLVAQKVWISVSQTETNSTCGF